MSSFQVGASTATFRSTIRGSRQASGDLPQLTLGIYFPAHADWQALLALVTSKYGVHVPVGAGSIVIDIVRGPGAGTLTIDGLGSTSAILTALERSTYTVNNRTFGSADFLITGTPI
jgi:hypothetical protein